MEKTHSDQFNVFKGIQYEEGGGGVPLMVHSLSWLEVVGLLTGKVYRIYQVEVHIKSL